MPSSSSSLPHPLATSSSWASGERGASSVLGPEVPRPSPKIDGLLECAAVAVELVASFPVYHDT